MAEVDRVGMAASIEFEVTPKDSAHAYGNPGVHVLATPALVAMFEKACMKAIEDVLAPGSMSVGAEVDIRHRAPTPIGERVRIDAVLREADGPAHWFAVEARDSWGIVGTGRHRRFVVDVNSFQARLEDRTRSGG